MAFGYAREPLCDVGIVSLCDHADHIVDGPFLGSPVDPDAISEIDSSDAHDGLVSRYTVSI